VAITTRTLLRRGVRHVLTADETTPFLDLARGALGVRSLAHGCGTGLCGACRVLVEGEPCNTCTMTLGAVPDGARVLAYEDLLDDPAAIAAVEAFTEERPTRCTLCVPCVGVTAVALARNGKLGDADAVEEMLATATCMCTGRGSLRRALLRAGAPRKV
jgi:aerobic-type carbon monoxide dehydrogenase small subunit (CoxS/CutS family)